MNEILKRGFVADLVFSNCYEWWHRFSRTTHLLYVVIFNCIHGSKPSGSIK
jgi:hypothetical protein